MRTCEVCVCVRVCLVRMLGYEVGSECPCVWAGMYVGMHALVVCVWGAL